jgi:clavulanate-9-aldehyde reductase
MQSVAEKYGRLDALVNNAGMLGPGAIGDADITSWRKSIETNLMGPILVTHAAVPLLKAAAGANVINISSTVTRGVNAGTAPYGAAKGGLNFFTESIRKELAPHGIRVTLVVLGLVESDFYSHAATDLRRGWMLEVTPLTPADVAAAIAYAIGAPAHVNIAQLEIRPTGQI